MHVFGLCPPQLERLGLLSTTGSALAGLVRLMVLYRQWWVPLLSVPSTKSCDRGGGLGARKGGCRFLPVGCCTRGTTSATHKGREILARVYARRRDPVHILDQPSALIGRSSTPGMPPDSWSASTTTHTSVPCRIVRFGLFGGHRLNLRS